MHVEEPRALPPFGLRPGYVLSVGTLEPRKNYVRLLQAFSLLRKRVLRGLPNPDLSGPAITPVTMLVIAGREGWMFEPIFREVARLGLEHLRCVSSQTPRTMTCWRYISTPACLSRRSLRRIRDTAARGYGLRRGPVVSSTVAGCRRLGDAALYLDPLDIRAMSDAIERGLTDEKCRRALLARGLARSSLYTWESAGRAILALFERVPA